MESVAAGSLSPSSDGSFVGGSCGQGRGARGGHGGAVARWWCGGFSVVRAGGGGGHSSDRNRFDKVHQENFGKSGCRRIVPGQLLSIDPKGRALCITALEKQKLVYVLNRDASDRLTISSPLEAHKSHTLTFALTALDCGFDNPVFGAIELEYDDCDRDPTGQAFRQVQKLLTFL